MKMSRIETAIRVSLAYYKAFNRHDVAAMVQLMSDDCIFESNRPAPDGAVYAGEEAITQFWQAFFHESPQAHIKLEEVFGLGKRCIARWKYEWIDELGKEGHIRGTDIIRVKDDAICETFSYIKG